MITGHSWNIGLKQHSSHAEQLKGTIDLEISKCFELELGGSPASAIKEDPLARELHGILATHTLPKIVAACSGMTKLSREDRLDTHASVRSTNQHSVRVLTHGSSVEVKVGIHTNIDMHTETNREVAMGESIWHARATLASHIVEQVILAIRQHFYRGPLSSQSSDKTVFDKDGVQAFSRQMKVQRPPPGNS